MEDPRTPRRSPSPTSCPTASTSSRPARGCHLSGRTVTCLIDTVPAGGRVTLALVVKVLPSAAGQPLVNTAVAAEGNTNPDTTATTRTGPVRPATGILAVTRRALLVPLLLAAGSVLTALAFVAGYGRRRRP